jgi:hypothetical protein
MSSNKRARQDTFPPGTYYVGDLCYVFRGEKWQKMCDVFLGAEGPYELDGMRFCNFSTMYGDGEYEDEGGRKYPVDAGCIGCVDVKHIADEDFKHIAEDEKEPCGHLITFGKPFTCSEDEGRLRFGHVEINTAGDSEEEEEEDEDDEDDEDEDEDESEESDDEE